MSAKMILALAFSLLSGCAVLGPANEAGMPPAVAEALDFVGNPASFAVCTAADWGTTTYLVSHSLGREVNPLLSGSVNAHKFIIFAAAKLAVIGGIWWLYDRYGDILLARLGIGTATVITCAVAAHNATLIIR